MLESKTEVVVKVNWARKEFLPFSPVAYEEEILVTPSLWRFMFRKSSNYVFENDQWTIQFFQEKPSITHSFTLKEVAIVFPIDERKKIYTLVDDFPVPLRDKIFAPKQHSFSFVSEYLEEFSLRVEEKERGGN